MGHISDDDVFMELSDGDMEEIIVPDEDVTASEIEPEQAAEQRGRLSSAERWYTEFTAPLLAGTIPKLTPEEIEEEEEAIRKEKFRVKPCVMNRFVDSDKAGLVVRIANARSWARCQVEETEGACSNATLAMITARGTMKDLEVAIQLMKKEETRLTTAISAKGSFKERKYTEFEVRQWIQREKIATFLREEKGVQEICQKLDCNHKTG